MAANPRDQQSHYWPEVVAKGSVNLNMASIVSRRRGLAALPEDLFKPSMVALSFRVSRIIRDYFRMTELAGRRWCLRG
jgi:hypothetical protein